MCAYVAGGSEGRSEAEEVDVRLPGDPRLLCVKCSEPYHPRTTYPKPGRCELCHVSGPVKAVWARVKGLPK